jgi:glycosyltransferase involved in cell wall biosynthesis
MPLLYAAASALVFPSQYEGGGLPVMEALACGCPAAVADIPATREFAGDAAAFFDPLDVASIADTLRRLQANPALRAELRTRGLQRAGRFRDNGAVLRLLEIYGRVAAGRRPGISRRGGPAAPLGCDF